MWKTERWHWNQKQKKIFNALKKSLSETAHLIISQATYEKIFKIDALNFAVDTYLY